MEIKNAQIESIMFGYEGHGVLTMQFYLSYGESAVQAFGGYNLNGGEELLKWVKSILEIVGVGDWEKVKGQYIRVKIVDGVITEIGNLLNDKWFNPKEISNENI